MVRSGHMIRVDRALGCYPGQLGSVHSGLCWLWIALRTFKLSHVGNNKQWLCCLAPDLKRKSASALDGLRVSVVSGGAA